MDWEDIDGSILERRAAELAKPRSDDGVEEITTLLLEFRMIGASYAVELKKVEAVSRIGDIFTIPLTPKHIPGIIRRRGESIAIVNLRHFFHPESEGLIDTDFAVIVNARGKRFALQVEEIEGVFHTPSDSLKPPPDNFDKAQAQYLSGVTLEGLAVLNLEKLVDAEGFGTMVKRGSLAHAGDRTDGEFMSANNDLTKEQMDQLAGVFRAEAIEHVRTLAEILFALEEGDETDVRGALARAFREAHSLKGSAGTLGFERVAIITHRFEDALGALSNGSVDFCYEIADTLLQTLEIIRKSITECLPGDDQLTEDETEAIRNLKKLLAGSTGKGGSASAPPAPKPKSNEPPHPTKGTSSSPATANERPSDNSADPSAARQEFIRISEDRLDIVIARFGELLESTIQLESVGHDMEANSAEAERLVSSMGDLLRKLDGNEHEADAMEILDLARNLMLMLSSASSRYSQEERQVSKLIQRTQEDLRQIRMAPISTVFIALRSQVRESSRAMGKRVDVEMEGGEYAVDRTVLDAIEDPLIHIVRNAVDHGIESPEERKKASKSETGKLKVTARHMGDSVELTISDDGRGVTLNNVRKTLIDKYGISEDHAIEMGSDELMDYLFESGFTTAADVSKFSGRGVGLDVVKYTIERLGGEVRLASEPGQGTDLTLRLPLTMSTIRCLLVRVAGRSLAIPSANVDKVLVLKQDMVSTVGGGSVIAHEGFNIPIAPLEDVLELSSDGEQTSSLTGCNFAAVVRFGDRRFAFGIEDIMEYAQLILKPLGDLLERVQNISGLTLLGTGETALILNPADLIRSAGGVTSERSRVRLQTAETDEGSITVLVADDSIATRTLEKTLLESAGYRVITAEDGLQALNLLNTNKVDLVISDVQMPNMSGFELTKNIKSRSNLSHLPVILITSLGSNEDKSEGMAAGADAYIVKKELTRAELVKTIRQLI